MKTFEGVCAACGQVQTVQATTKKEADEKAALTCNCDEGVILRRQLQLNEKLKEIACIAEGSPQEFKPLEEDVYRELYEIGKLVIFNKIQSVSMNVEATTIKITIGSKGNIKVTRSLTTKILAEI